MGERVWKDEGCKLEGVEGRDGGWMEATQGGRGGGGGWLEWTKTGDFRLSRGSKGCSAEAMGGASAGQAAGNGVPVTQFGQHDL